MILSEQDTFDKKAAITVSRASTNTIDLKQAGRDIGNADGLWLHGLVTTAFTAGGAATLAAALIQSDAANLSSADTLLTLLDATGKASLVKGFELFKLRLPLGRITKRYIGLYWTVATGPMLTGAVSAHLTPNVDAWKSYPRGYVNH